MAVSKAKPVARMVGKAGVFRLRELDRVGIPWEYLCQAKDRGLVRQVGRGLYVADGSRLTEHHRLVEAVKRVPHAVICLLSALRFHGLTTQATHDVWIAIAHKARRPRVDYPPMRVVYFSGGISFIWRRGKETRRHYRARLWSRKDRRRLFQVPRQDRAGCCPRSAA
jgi:predicted transcriptional regulator of viral defense system